MSEFFRRARGSYSTSTSQLADGQRGCKPSGTFCSLYWKSRSPPQPNQKKKQNNPCQCHRKPFDSQHTTPSCVAVGGAAAAAAGGGGVDGVL